MPQLTKKRNSIVIARSDLNRREKGKKRTVGGRGMREQVVAEGSNLRREAGNVVGKGRERVLVVVGGEEAPRYRHQTVDRCHPWGGGEGGLASASSRSAVTVREAEDGRALNERSQRQETQPPKQMLLRWCGGRRFLEKLFEGVVGPVLVLDFNFQFLPSSLDKKLILNQWIFDKEPFLTIALYYILKKIFLLLHSSQKKKTFLYKLT